MAVPKLILITGKGGVGKSVIAAALARTLAGQKKKVALIELDDQYLCQFFEKEETSYTGKKLSQNIIGYDIQAKLAFREYAIQKLKSKLLYKIILDNRLVANFVHATPGLNEILALGKITEMMRSNKFDHIILDAPATGHTIALLDAPRVAFRALKHGPLKSQTEGILSLLQNQKETGLIFVTLPEDLPVEEGLELYCHLEQKLKLHTLGSIINGNMQALPEILSSEPSKAEQIKDWQKTLARGVQHYKKRLKSETKQRDYWAQNFQKPILEIPWLDAPSQQDLSKAIAERLTPWIATL